MHIMDHWWRPQHIFFPPESLKPQAKKYHPRLHWWYWHVARRWPNCGEYNIRLFSNIFKTNGPTDTSTVIDAIQPVVTDSMNRFLCQPSKQMRSTKHSSRGTQTNHQVLTVCHHFFISTFGPYIMSVLQKLYLTFSIWASFPHSLMKLILSWFKK